MNRRQWLAHSGRLTLETMGLGNVLKNLKPSILHPVVFTGHGCPMNATENNVFSRGMISLSKQLAKPQLILVVSAHWETSGIQITAMPKPCTIYDFGGFPDALYHVHYLAPGAPEFPRQTCYILSSFGVHPNYTWGLDHGAWTVIRPLFSS